MKNNLNPWEGLKPSEKKRVDNIKREFECFWVMDSSGKYGYYVESKLPFQLPKNQTNLEGISLISENSKLVLILEDNQNWKIFKRVCDHLSEETNELESAESFVKKVQATLKKLHDMFKFARNKSMTPELQMGLFSELSCIKDILEPHLKINQSIKSWVGHEKDKQDFLLDNLIIEIKSHRTSKSPTANISSKGQLYSEKEPIYLISYALTTNASDGPTIIDLVDEIEAIISKDEENSELVEYFHIQLDNYGYNPEFTNEKPALQFLIDNVTCYDVNDDFPKLTEIPAEINHLQYGIDLTQCKNFIVSIDDFFIDED
jgi:hypothetical protein